MGGEMLFLLVLGLMLFGPDELPKIARTIGRVAYEIKKASSEVQNEVRRTVSLETEKAAKEAKEATDVTDAAPRPPEPEQEEFSGEGRK